MRQEVDEELEGEDKGEGRVQVVCHLPKLRGRAVAEPHLAAVLRLEDADQEVLRRGAGDCPEPLYVEVRMGKSFTAMISRAEVACNQGESKTFRTLNWSRANLVLAAALSLARFERFLSNFTK